MTQNVLICFNRASYTIKTHFPKDRTIFIAAEPDVIHPYSRRFLEQYGLVLTTSKKALSTEKNGIVRHAGTGLLVTTFLAKRRIVAMISLSR